MRLRACFLFLSAVAALGAVAALPSACSTASRTSGPTGDGGVDAGPVHLANGTIGAWQTAAPLPIPRANHCSVFANGYLVVIGGNYEPAGSSTFKSIDEVDVAKVSADGTLGPWQAAGKTPSPVNSCTAVANGSAIVILDGIYDDDTLGGKPQAATLAADGTLSAFAPSGTLPADVRVLYSSALAHDGTLYTMFSRLPGDGDTVSLLTAPIDSSGTLGAFAEQKWLPGFRGHPAYAFAPPFAYAIGGYGSATDAGNVVLADGYGTKIDPQTGAGAPFPIAPLPTPTSFGAAIAVDSFVFVAGGKDGVLDGTGSGTVMSGQIDGAGKVSTWSTLAALPQGRTSLSVAAGGDFLFVTGGGYKAGGLDTVFVAQVRFAP